MVAISQPPPDLAPDVVSLYYTTEPLLSNAPILVFHGPSTTTNATLNTARIQAHVFTPAGFRSFPRLTISPNSPLYAAVDHIPREQQGDEVCRGLAVSLLKYWIEMPDVVKKALVKSSAIARGGAAPHLLDDVHAGEVASRMVRTHNVAAAISDVRAALSERSVSWVDLDVILPQGVISDAAAAVDGKELASDDPSLSQYGPYAPLIQSFGSPVFIPTSKLRRAPSKPTPVGRSRSLLKHQKESLRREMEELFTTEVSYVTKLENLTRNVVKDFRQNSSSSIATGAINEEYLAKLFPSSLEDILTVNSHFLDDVNFILQETETQAAKDCQFDDDAPLKQNRAKNSNRATDGTGVLAFSEVLLDWFPKFASCYTDYLRASSDFNPLLSGLLKENASTLSQRVHQIGEQRLRSMIFEPIQRLPRYSLYIDSIVKHLPVSHPALDSLLKARDIVTDICSLESSSSSEKVRTVTRFKRLIASWPDSFQPRGRFITAADFQELSPPYHIDLPLDDAGDGLFLIFADCLVIVRKSKGTTLSARGVIAEADRLDGGSSATSASMSFGDIQGSPELFFSGWIKLQDVRLSDSSQSHLLWVTFTEEVLLPEASLRRGGGSAGHGACVRVFRLLNSYVGKTARLMEEMAKARIEGRFSEAERESDEWALRSVNFQEKGIGLLATVFAMGENQTFPEGRKPAPITLCVDPSRGSMMVEAGKDGVEIAASVTLAGSDLYQLEIDGLEDNGTSDLVNAADFLPTLTRRLANLLRLQNQIENPALTGSYLSFNRKILRSLMPNIDDQPRTGTIRTTSPVKMLSNLLGGSSRKEIYSPSKHHEPPPLMGDLGSISRATFKLSRSNSRKKADQVDDASQVTLVGPSHTGNLADPLKRLEDTFGTYVLSLQSMKGNILGKSLRARAEADELRVNEIYNTLLEDPAKVYVAVEASANVLFAAFEKFLSVAWKEQMGPIIASNTLKSIQDKFDSLFPGDFEDFFKGMLSEMAPQNRRAVEAIMSLLADLLEASGNDGDRGELTAAFAELLISEGNPHDFISLLDRVVEDYDSFFAGKYNMLSTKSGEATPLSGSVNSARRAKHAKSASVTSNTSSFRKKWGFNTLSRENSKVESESKVSSVWRTLSKTARGAAYGDAPTASLSKASLNRSKSTDTIPKSSPYRRPVSRDRPAVLGPFSFENPADQASPLPAKISTITADRTGSPRKKRRSSLSDLQALQEATPVKVWHSLDQENPGSVRQSAQMPETPRTPSPSKKLRPSPQGTVSPNRFVSPSHFDSSSKENPPVPEKSLAGNDSPLARKNGSPAMTRSTLTERAHNIGSDEASFANDGSPSRNRNSAISSIPKMRISHRQDSPSNQSPDSTSPKKPVPSFKKLRMQSPQKLRERLQSEQKAIASAEGSLQAELSKIGDEISALSLRPTTAPTTAAAHHQHAQRGPPFESEIRNLTARVNNLENKVSSSISDIKSHTSAMAKDVESSLTVSESRFKKLDELYGSASKENELLYERFNKELEKMLGAIREGDGVEEMRRRVKETGEEFARVKRENLRLKRENVGLRSQLKGA
ncbi:MAG: hypothetical protein M1819_001414 [Sarea resinae]|nr:MAG: hypothetical protein M1819_001414 [Sarea resinae]